MSFVVGPGYALLGEFLDPVFSSGDHRLQVRAAGQCMPGAPLCGEAVDWEAEFSVPLRAGVKTFRRFVESWYEGGFQKIIYHPQQQPEVRDMISSILAGYAWDTNNPYVADDVAAACACWSSCAAPDRPCDSTAAEPAAGGLRRPHAEAVGGTAAAAPVAGQPAAPLALQQQLHFRFGTHERDLDALLEADAQQVQLAVQAMGQTGVRLQWDGRQPSSVAAAVVPPSACWMTCSSRCGRPQPSRPRCQPAGRSVTMAISAACRATARGCSCSAWTMAACSWTTGPKAMCCIESIDMGGPDR